MIHAKTLDFTIPKEQIERIRLELSESQCSRCRCYLDDLDYEEGHCPDCLLAVERK